MRPWVTAVIAACVSCGSPSEPQVDAPRPIDAAPRPDAGCAMGCDPLIASSCSGTQRCTWLVNPAQPRGGDTACLPNGGVAVGLPCMRDANGGDNCVKGATCYMNVCRQICDLAATASICGTQLTCRATPLFTACTGTTPVAGLCVP